MPAPKKPADRKPKATAAKGSKKHGSGWKKSSPNAATEVTMPSGETAMLRRPGVQGLISEGLLDSLDTLTALVSNETIPKAEGRPGVNLEQVAQQLKQVGPMLEFIDKIVVHVVAEPTVLPVPYVLNEDGTPSLDGQGNKIEADRDEDAVYVDYIDLQDRTFIMNFAVGGMTDLAAFREKSLEAVGGVSPQ